MAMVGSITRGEVMGTPGTQIQWTGTDSEKVNKNINENSDYYEESVEYDYSEIIVQNAFQGDVPYETIIEGLEKQFIDYINIEDKTNFVDIFYDQLHASYEIINSNEEEEHPAEMFEALNDIQDKFINTLSDLFEQRLTITFIDLSGDIRDYDDIEFILRRSYEFFILGAYNNFKIVIATYVFPKVCNIADDKEYFKMIRELIDSFNPLITSFGPTEFLQYRDEKEILEMYENGKIVGNFLRKYSPKFYQNEEFMVEVINYITMIGNFKADLIESNKKFIKSNVSEDNAGDDSDDDSEPEQRVYEYGENYENEYEIGSYVD